MCEFSTVNIYKTIPNKYNKQTVSYLNVSIYEFLSYHVYWRQYQNLQLWGFSSVWVKLLVLMFPELLKPFPQLSHLYSFSPVCISKCCFKFELSVNPSPQYVQQKGLSPVSVSKCLCTSPRCTYHLSHVMHMCGFSPVCESPSFFSSLPVTNPFPQSWLRCGTSPLCFMLWTLILSIWLQPMLPTAHTYHLLSPLQTSEPSLSDTVPDAECTWSVLTPGSALFPLTENWQTKCSQLLAEEYSSLFCNKEKNSPILTQTNQQLRLVQETAVVWENIQDNCQLSVHRTNCLISTIITEYFTCSTSNAHHHSLHIFWNYNHKKHSHNFSPSKGLYVQHFNSFLSLTDSLLRIKQSKTKTISNSTLL